MTIIDKKLCFQGQPQPSKRISEASLINTKGIIYCATGKDYVKEANISVESLKAKNNFPVTLFVDESSKKYAINIYDNIQVIAHPRYSFYDKIHAIRETPYQETLFLDTDTYVIDILNDVFLLLDNFDMAIAHSVGRYSKFDCPEVPRSFVQLNTGVIAYKMSAKIHKLCKTWYDDSKNMRGGTDQVPFRTALYKERDISFYALTPEYNFRSLFPAFASKKVKIIHDRNFIMFSDKKKRKYITKINSTDNMRVYNFTTVSTRLKSSLVSNRLVRMLYKMLRYKESGGELG